jgi:HopA1 effector protein family
MYIRKEAYPAVVNLLGRIYPLIAPFLKPGTPVFTKPLAPGIGLAEDPGQAESFGQHRCRLLADGMIGASWADWPTISGCDLRSQRGRRISRHFPRVILKIVHMCQCSNIERIQLVQLTNERLLRLSISVAHCNQSEN